MYALSEQSIGPGIVLCIIFVTWIAEYIRFRAEGVHLALTGFEVDPNLESDEPIHIEGRPSGLIPWLFSMFGSEGGYVFRASRADVTFEFTTPTESQVTYLPAARIASTLCTYRQPYSLYAAAVAACAFGLFRAAFVWMFAGADDYVRMSRYSTLRYELVTFAIVGVVSWALFLALRRVLISVESVGGGRWGFSFRRGVLRGRPMDFDRALDAVEALNNLALVWSLEPHGIETGAVHANP